MSAILKMVLVCGLYTAGLAQSPANNSNDTGTSDFNNDYGEECDELCEYLQTHGISDDINEVSNTTTSYIHDILYYICLPITCSIGILAIVTTITVLHRKSMATSTNSYLFALAFADLVFLIIILTRTLDRNLGFGYYYLIYMEYATIVLKICLLTSVWLTVVLGIERHVAISQPLHAQRLCTIRNARIVIVATYSLALLCRLPDFFQFKIEWWHDKKMNLTYPHAVATSLAKLDWWRAFQRWFIDCTLTALLPIFLLTALNVKLILEVRRSVSRMRSISNPYSPPNLITREEMRITAMLIAIIVIFFLLQAPYVISVALLNPEAIKTLHGAYIIVQDITFILVSMKTAMNFVLYCWFSERFWTLLKSMIFCEECRKRRGMARRNTNNESSGTTNHVVKYSNVMTRDTAI